MEEKIFCSICEKEIKESDLTPNWEMYSCNGAVLGMAILLKGHRRCIQNVDKMVVQPNRLRLIGFVQKLKKEFEETEMKDSFLRLIDGGLLPQA